jgi:hypothetical protein
MAIPSIIHRWSDSCNTNDTYSCDRYSLALVTILEKHCGSQPCATFALTRQFKIGSLCASFHSESARKTETCLFKFMNVERGTIALKCLLQQNLQASQVKEQECSILIDCGALHIDVTIVPLAFELRVSCWKQASSYKDVLRSGVRILCR